jgi:hypothetical protein
MEQPPNAVCIYSSRMVKNYRICPIRIGIIHGRHRVVQFTHGLGLYILRFHPSLSLIYLFIILFFKNWMQSFVVLYITPGA